MTQRERHASGGLSATVSAPPPGGATGHPAPARPGPSQEVNPPRASLWEDVFRSASPAQQKELLALAGRQGLIYAHQLPQISNGARSQPADDPRGLHLLSHLLQGQTADLEPVRPEPVQPTDAALDERQRDAVARALSTPDICLIQGLPGTGKSRVVAELVTQAAARGERVLLVAPSTAALDRVLELLPANDILCPVRCLGPDERPEELSSTARASTFAERVRTLRETALAEVVRARASAEQRCQRQRLEEAAWPRLEHLAGQYDRLGADLAALAGQRDRAPAEVAVAAAQATDPAATDEFAVAVARAEQTCRAARARLEEVRAGLAKQREERAHDLDALTTQAESLTPLVEAKSHGRWWSPSYWRATFQGDVPAKLTALQAERETVLKKVQVLDDEEAALARDLRAAEDTLQAERRRLIEGETARRLAELDGQSASLRERQRALEGEWAEARAGFNEKASPETPTPDAVRAARERWRAQLQEDEQRCAFARQWAAYLEESADGLAERLPGYANLVAATTATLPGDRHFGDVSSTLGQFDLLVLEEAEGVTESELLKLARRARRWVLVGEPTPNGEPTPAEAPPRRGHYRSASPSAALARTQVFQRLWQSLHADPTRLPYAWVHEGERLCCRLRPLAPEQRQGLESERVEDCPDIELRILALPRVRPLLAEVVFPPSMTVARAKEFIYRELQELPVQAAAHSLLWREEPERLVLCLTEEAPDGAPATVALEPGVREVVDAHAEVSCHTFALEFDRAFGWTQPRAEQWVASHLHLSDLGRTARLEVPYRMAPGLARVVSDVLFGNAYRVLEAPRDHAASDAVPVEFVAVPPLPRKAEAVPTGRSHERSRREPALAGVRAASVAAFPKGGAGLEQDLAVLGHGERLPAEVRAELPRRGLVNYLEAQAVVRKLEELAADPAVRDAGAAQDGPQVAVIALYSAQAELIRRLIRQSVRLAVGGLRLAVDVPGAFRQREVPVALVSLTRSHTHRAVSFGEEAHLLGLALTRARGRLILFGDPGTLARRSHWSGVLDHLDEAAAAREGTVIGHLVRYLQGCGGHPGAFRFCEGGGT